MWKRRYTALAAAAGCVMAGCGMQGGEMVPRETAMETVMETADAESAIKEYGIFNYDYTGYQDECVGWGEYESFVGQDYDRDGMVDRVYKVHLFDKWSDCGLFAVLGYKDGRYVIDRWMRTNEEFSEEPVGEDSCWGLTDYLLCSRIMEAGGQLVSVGLWLGSGTYGNEEEFVPGYSK